MFFCLGFNVGLHGVIFVGGVRARWSGHVGHTGRDRGLSGGVLFRGVFSVRFVQCLRDQVQHEVSLGELFAGSERLALQMTLDALEEFFGDLECHDSAFFSHLNAAFLIFHHVVISEYDSENLMYSVIQEVLSDEEFSSIGCAVHFSLATLVKDYEPLTEEERKYARNPLTHVDFLLFNQMDKQPVLAIEVDGGSHKSGSKQAERDAKKNSILDKCAIPLLRLRTDGSGEKEKIRNALKRE